MKTKMRLDKRFPATVNVHNNSGVYIGSLVYRSYNSVDEIKTSVRAKWSGKLRVSISQDSGYYRQFIIKSL